MLARYLVALPSLLLALAAATITTAAEAKVVRVFNKTSRPVSIAYRWWGPVCLRSDSGCEPRGNGWTNEGWYPVQPHSHLDLTYVVDTCVAATWGDGVDGMTGGPTNTPLPYGEGQVWLHNTRASRLQWLDAADGSSRIYEWRVDNREVSRPNYWPRSRDDFYSAMQANGFRPFRRMWTKDDYQEIIFQN